MTTQKLYLGDKLIKFKASSVQGEYIYLGTEKFYRISNYDLINPFFISLVSHTDLWLFISTTGGLTAGRKNKDSSLFPYNTDDKIADSAETTGSRTLIHARRDKMTYLWEPFSNLHHLIYSIERNLYKNTSGNTIIFEENNNDLELSFRYTWQFSEKYGFVKRAEINNSGTTKIHLEILDGIQNILPYGISSDFQNTTSNLANAYKKNELDPATGLAMFSLSSMIVDKAEPSEALKTTTVWNTNPDCKHILLSNNQVNKFRYGDTLQTETDLKATPGSYYIHSSIELSAEEESSWQIIADINQDHSDVSELIRGLSYSKSKLTKELLQDVELGTQALNRLVGKADGIQLSADELINGRHFSNVLFNIMRGGIFEDQYTIDKQDLLKYCHSINKDLVSNEENFFNQLAANFSYNYLIKFAEKNSNKNLIRICYEYLPLYFSRRHGDPSRPWNKFSIETKHADGSSIKNYEGNWRDIFQNWEALAISFPDYIWSMITKFVNASTLDGYNPYRITRKGIDWEIIEPDDPWSYIGYWGDHQIIYLLKLLELAKNHQSDGLSNFLSNSIFVYSNVPYRIKGYAAIVKNPQDTIDFDGNTQLEIDQRVLQKGADGKLVLDENAQLIYANLTEKLLVTLLAKLSNFIPEAGIWLNTQRPEWNDANNALVGNGVSMVTLYYLRRFIAFCLSSFQENQKVKSYKVHKPVVDLLKGIVAVFESNKSLLSCRITNEDRKRIVDKLGTLGEIYRANVYVNFDNCREEIKSNYLHDFFKLTLEYLDHSIRANKRSDGLYHAYNLLRFTEDKLSIDRLYEMLEGQVALLSAKCLKPEDALEVLDALKKSKIYRADQYSYMLYPNRELPRFLEKNQIPASFIKNSQLAQALISDQNHSIIKIDGNGISHFNGSFNNANSLKLALNSLKTSSYAELVKAEYNDYLNLFEQMFNHKAFTGRSGTFYGYEGLGSIYWHMVSKLLLAVQENIYWAYPTHQGTKTLERLTDHYYEIRAGIGTHKSPDLYGSFPTDPYSHTPINKGVQQPGMTGQVKEDILNRWAELGVRVEDSIISFEPIFLNSAEFLTRTSTMKFYNVQDSLNELELNTNEIGFTYCQVPIIYKKAEDSYLEIHLNSGQIKRTTGKSLSKEISNEIFRRTNYVRLIKVFQSF